MSAVNRPDPRPPQSVPLEEQPRVPLVDPVQEIRLALVLYGGVSLAIYIAGVVREIHRLVRATAASEAAGGPARVSDAELDAGEIVYRQLGRMLGRQPGDGDQGPIRSRFVVDAIAGTSAGGINGAFLAKALANDQQLAPLKNLWLGKGDLDRLLDRSAAPESLLNSTQMYDDILAALDGMDAGRAAQPPSDGTEINLWLTATDLRGRSEPLPLNEQVRELRHRHVFRFSCEPGDSGDFGHAVNPLLAFAARCTSSFPVAFRPMQLHDCWPSVLKRDSDTGRLRRLFHRWRPSADPTQDLDRSYGDGGYLDNKPFSYIIDHLGHEAADLPVIRTLIYVEPVPEAPTEGAAERPDAIENARAALLDLPRREGIRADLEAVQARNRLVATVNALIPGIEKDVAQADNSESAAPVDTTTWRQFDLRDCIRRHGATYGVYHRLKVQTVLDHLGGVATRLCGFGMGSAEHDGLRMLIEHWRRQQFAEFHGDVPRAGTTENDFLLRFDWPYRQRRLAFLIRRMGDLAHAPFERRREILAAAGQEAAIALPDIAEQASIMRKVLARIAREVRAAEQRLRDTPGNPAASAIAPLAAAEAEFIRAATTPRSSERQQIIAALWTRFQGDLSAFTDQVDSQLKNTFISAADALRAASAALGTSPAAMAVAACVAHTTAHFDRYDLILFPIRYGTALGEPTAVKVVRISPLDTPSLINEQDPNELRHKLAGTVLNNFGAFLDLRWRRNDFMWGRLDACERLISSSLSDDPEQAQKMIATAQEAILREELGGEDRGKLADLLATALVAHGATPDEDDRALLRRLDAAKSPTGAKALLRSLLSGTELRQLLRDRYEVDRHLPPARTLRLVGNAAAVAGRLCGRLGDRYPLLRGPAGWLLRLGRLVAIAVELAMPGGFGSLAFRHAVVLLYLLEALLLAGGVITGQPAAVDVGGRLLVLTAACHLGLGILGQWLGGKNRAPWWRVLLWVVAIVGLVLFGLALVFGAAQLAAWLEKVPGFSRV